MTRRARIRDEWGRAKPPEPPPASVWLAASGHLRWLEIEGPLLAGEAAGVVNRLDSTRFDEPVTIEPPTTE